ncbi:hypothetical protein QNH36_21475 [Mesobacillus sp. AQ2]|uniref:hypothetical protein n=1 Tax=Mesobacillus sp. AQ2 TaxID=3043332 RepID=UPI0024C1AC74|nr:hypothetical protein [Mesobacillus sp. AQ2]WHX40185.1 hypothetical protein QNH36_21475 [Mesobacillus sp. AQ2]
MALSIYLTISILILHFTYHLRKPLSFLENGIIFMVVAIITRQCLTLLALEWGLYRMTEDSWLFICLLLCRDLLTPLMTIIFINFYVRAVAWGSKMTAFFIALGVLLALHKLAVDFDLITYIKWNFFYTTLLNAGFLLSGIAVFKIISIFKPMENVDNESL